MCQSSIGGSQGEGVVYKGRSILICEVKTYCGDAGDDESSEDAGDDENSEDDVSSENEVLPLDKAVGQLMVAIELVVNYWWSSGR